MSRLLCCLCARHADMGAALSRVQEGEACDGAVVPAAPPTMADVIRERKKKAGGAALGTLRRRIAAAARRPRDARPDRGCEHARFIRSVVSSWRLAEVFLLCEELEAGLALRDLCTQAELAREPAAALHTDLHKAFNDRWWSDVELVGAGFSITAHRAILSARCTYFRDLLQRYPPSARRVPLEGAAGALSCDEASVAVVAVYAAGGQGCLAHKYERGGADDELDIINVEGNSSCRGMSSCRCAASRVEASTLRRLAGQLGFSLDSLHRDMRYLLDSGEAADARLVFCVENGSGAQYGFRQSTELLCHRVVLSARSRFFKSVMARRANMVGVGGAAGGPAAVYIDEKVLPRRFARALLHAAYTDQVDLSLIGRSSSSPASTASAGSGNTPWGGVARGRGTTSAMLEDAFQLYEIARFLEMPIAVQGCEDAIVEALCAETLPAVLRWARAPHASQWVHRQAMRYLRDEFPSIMSSSASAALPRAALADALASPFLQASEAQALRGVVRWGERTVGARSDSLQPNVVWHTAHTARRGRGRRDAGDAALRELLASLLPHLRLEHLPPDHEQLQQLVRRGVIPPPAEDSEAGSACAWLARGNYRSPRCFLPYLDEIKALLEDQAVPEAELARARRAKYMHRIPDTLYMVAAARGAAAPGGGPSAGADGACVSPRRRAALRARVRELRSAPPAVRARALHANDTSRVATQIALRAVRELSLPDACAELLLADADDSEDTAHDTGGRSRSSGEWEYDRTERTERSERSERSERQHRRWADADIEDECCSASGSLRYASSGSLRGHHPLHMPVGDSSRAGTCRREPPARTADGHQHRAGVARAAGAAGVAGGAARLSARVPDVAMAPNANTHLLTQHNYFTMHSEYSGGVLQLDLGDGATHTPRPGSRAARAMAAHAGRHRDAPPGPCARPRADEDELRAAIELSVIRAYSAFHPRAPSPAPHAPHAPARPRPAPANTLPQAYRPPQQARSLATPSPSALSASNSGHLSAAARQRAASDHSPHSAHSAHSQEHHPLSRVGSSGLGSGLALSRDGAAAARDVSLGLAREGLAMGSASPASAASSPSPRRRPHDRHLLHHTHSHRSEASRSHSPSDYA